MDPFVRNEFFYGTFFKPKIFQKYTNMNVIKLVSFCFQTSGNQLFNYINNLLSANIFDLL